MHHCPAARWFPLSLSLSMGWSTRQCKSNRRMRSCNTNRATKTHQTCCSCRSMTKRQSRWKSDDCALVLRCIAGLASRQRHDYGSGEDSAEVGRMTLRSRSAGDHTKRNDDGLPRIRLLSSVIIDPKETSLRGKHRELLHFVRREGPPEVNSGLTAQRLARAIIDGEQPAAEENDRARGTRVGENADDSRR